MSFFDDVPPVAAVPRHRMNVDYLHRMGCKACPLSLIKTNRNPDMPASGAEKPLVYLLAEAPGKTEDEEDEQLVGESGQLVRARIPKHFRGKVRFNNVIRTRPPGNRDPEPIEIECCRPSVVKDIEQSKPKAIFGFGNFPLEWVMGPTLQGGSMWRGRRMPVKVGNHTCWYYPMMHPAYILRQRRFRDGGPTSVGSEDERMFALDLERAFEEVDAGLPEPRVHTAKDVWDGIECITEYGLKGVARVRNALAWAFLQPSIGIDYETKGLRPYAKKAKILTAAFANREKGYAFPFDHPDAGWTKEEREEIADLWIDFLANYKGIKYVHNLAFELEWTAVHFSRKLVRAGRWEDSSVQASILDERKGKNKPGCFSLEFLVQQHFGFNLKKLTDLDKSKLDEYPVEIVLRYNGGDAKYHDALGLDQAVDLKREGLVDVYRDALRRVPTVVLTQLKGVPVNQKEVSRLKTKYKGRVDKLFKEIAALPIIKKFDAGSQELFNPLSNDDVLYVFKDMLNRPEIKIYDKKKRKERYSAGEEVLDKIDHPLAKKLIDLRSANKQLSTYIEPLDPEFKGRGKISVVHPDGLIHATFNTIFSEAGRLSCEDPNLQNFPKRDGEAREVRKQVKAPPGCCVLAVDFGQIEARVIAMFTKDKAFVKALWEDYDVHMEWAERLARAYPARVGGKKNFTDKKVMKDFRTDIKNQWTFPLFFGATLQSAAGYLKIPEEDLAPEYDRFWKVFADAKRWQEEQLEFYRENGYVECLTGRRRRGPLTTNQVYNSPVQGTAAEIVMDAMCRLSETGDPDLQPNINIHDDFTYCDVPLERVDEIAEKVITAMLDVPYDFVNVPIAVEASVGPDWLNLEEFGKFSSATWFK